MRATLALLPLMLSACGGGSDGQSSDDASRAFSPGGDIVNACASSYHRELIGTYGGQIEFASDRPGSEQVSCAWEADVEVSGGYATDPTYRRFCDLESEIVATPLPGSDIACGALEARGELHDALKAALPGDWRSPDWPVQGDTILAADVPGGTTVYPVGVDGIATRQITWIFDGRGNLTLSRALESAEWSGLLVKD